MGSDGGRDRGNDERGTDLSAIFREGLERFLLDTHTLIWFITSPERLPISVYRTIVRSDAQALVSFASLWEMSIKMGLGKLPEVGPSIAAVAETMREQSIDLLDLTVDDLAKGLTLPLFHRDPFDRMLIAQALRLDLPVLSIDREFAQYGVEVLW